MATRRDWFLELFLGSVSELIMRLLFFIVTCDLFQYQNKNCFKIISSWTARSVVKNIAVRLKWEFVLEVLAAHVSIPWVCEISPGAG